MRFLSSLFLVAALITISEVKGTTPLRKEVSYNPAIPDPIAYFGFTPGERHLSHEQIVGYARELARVSDRVKMEEYARSHEFRPLVHMVFTDSRNHERMDQLKLLHTKYIRSEADDNPDRVPLVVMLGYGVHGNESSASNASVYTMYYLAAANSPFIDSLLRQSVILVDPVLNPDGFTRHSTWVNMHQGKTDVSDPAARGFTEAWPGGRGNHYWFDLNRDYLFLVHPESRGRVEKFHEWLPAVVTDHHEMGAQSTFFFQPGIPTRNNPLVPQKNYELTDRIAAFHRTVFDSRGELYYSEESFDDYYVGKGSSYPDICGSIGILFEQAGYRGKIRETSYGIRTLEDAIRNQFDVSLSTLEAAHRMRAELLRNQREFYASAKSLAAADPVKAWLIGDLNDPVKLNKFAEILLAHNIEIHHLAAPYTRNNKEYKPGRAILVSMNQNQYRLVKSLFEPASYFTDSAFYDVSAWNLPMAFNMEHTTIHSIRELQQIKGDLITEKPEPEGIVSGPADSYAWLLRWDNYHAPAALWQLQKNGLRTMVATRKFTVSARQGVSEFGYGTIVIPAAGQQGFTPEKLFQLIGEISGKWKVEFTGVPGGRTLGGPDLGSGSFVPLKPLKALMIAGESTNSREAGEIWHLLDQRYEIPLTMTDITSVRNLELSEYTTLILPGGNLQRLTAPDTDKIKTWVSSGGTLITTGDAAQWVSGKELAGLKFKKPAEQDTDKSVPYAERSAAAAIHTVAGVILNAEMDITHPVAFGYHTPFLPVFKTGSRVAETPSGAWESPVKFTGDPWLSGYISGKNIERISGAPVVTIFRNGNGSVISFMESPNFRGIWLGKHTMFANALFFGPIIR